MEHQDQVTLEQAMAWHNQGNLSAAKAAYQAILQQHSNHVDALHLLGVIHLQQDELDKAIGLIKQAAKLNTKSAVILNNLATAYQRNTQITLAKETYQAALTIDPDYLSAQINLAELYQQQGDLAQAADCFKAALANNPNLTDCHHNLAIILTEFDQLHSAQMHCKLAIQLNPELASAQCHLAEIYIKQRKLDKATTLLNQITQTHPKVVNSNLLLAVIAIEQRQYPQAEQLCRLALQQQPNHLEGLNHLAIALQMQQQFSQALTLFEQAISLAPEQPQARYNRGLLRLMLGQYQAGFADYEARTELAVVKARQFTSPKWTGQPLINKRLLIHTEQAHGDNIQFSRFLFGLKQTGTTLIVECKPALQSIWQTINEIDTLVVEGQAIPAHDYHISLLSLPYQLGIDSQSLPKPINIFASTVANTSSKPSSSFKVGLVWAARTKIGAIRSTTLTEFSQLLAVEGIDFYSLQLPLTQQEKSEIAHYPGLIDLSDDMNDFADAARAIAQLDLLICVDTAYAHVAGTMGIPVWVLLPHVCDWRWQCNTTNSIWYPTAKLFRQPKVNDWKAVINHVLGHLKGTLEKS